MTIEGKRQSNALTEGPSRAAARSYFRGIGFSKDDLHKPIIGVANTWTEIGPCNFHLREVAAAVKQGIREAGGTPMEFNTVTIHDGITMGTQGMKASLVSREVIADSVELVARGNLFDGIIGIGGCDKNMPAMIMALCRLNIPGMMLYGGSIAPGKLNGPDGTVKDITILNVFEAIGSHARGTLDDAGLEAVEAAACPGAGACGGQFTANTMAMAAEILGMSPIELSGVPATSPAKHEASRKAGHMLMEAVRANRRPSDIITRASIENAIASVAASGGSTNGVLHLLAIAREMNIPLTIDDFDRISDKTPFICDLSPAGKYVASDYQAAGGSRLLAQRMINAGLLGSPRWLFDDHQRQDPRRRSRASRRDTRPASHQNLRSSHQASRRPGHPQRQPLARRLGDEDLRSRSRRASRTRSRLQFRRRLLRRCASPADQSRRRSRHPL